MRGCWELNPYLLLDQQVHLAPEPSLQLIFLFLCSTKLFTDSKVILLVSQVQGFYLHICVPCLFFPECICLQDWGDASVDKNTCYATMKI